MTGKPLWRRAYDTVERPVAVRLEDAVQTDLFADVAGLLVRTRADVSRRFERTTRHAWHRINLPAASDVARLRDQVVATAVRGPAEHARIGEMTDEPVGGAHRTDGVRTRRSDPDGEQLEDTDGHQRQLTLWTTAWDRR